MEKKNVSVVYDRKKRFEKTGKGNVEIIIYFRHNTRKYILVGEGSPSNWLAIANSVKVQQQVKDCEAILQAMDAIGEECTPDNFNRHYEKKEKTELLRQSGNIYNGVDQGGSFIEYMLGCIDGEDLRKGSRKNKLVIVNTVHKFGKLDRFCDISVANITALNDWLLKDGTRSVHTVYNYHKKLKMYITKLYDAGMIPDNPYRVKKFPRGSTKQRRPLTEEELVKIRNLKLTKEKLIRARDLFIFSAYTGLSYCDVMEFDFKTHTEKVGDMYYIDGSRIKTGSNFFTPILKPAMDVLVKYNYKLPHLCNQKVNDYLHLIEAQLGLNKPMTCHMRSHNEIFY